MESRLIAAVQHFGLGADDEVHLRKNSKATKELEDKWTRIISRAIGRYAKQALQELNQSDKVTNDGALADELADLFFRHAFDTMAVALRLAEDGHQRPIRLAGKYKVPRSLPELRKLYDYWRKKKTVPPKFKAQAEEVRAVYLKKIHSVWQKYSMDFRAGDVATQKHVSGQIMKAAQVTFSRAKNTVCTETTNYYNDARVAFYDASPDVTHYLSLAIRDAGTSKWCTDKTIDGKRGRHGLVYTKGTELCVRERPSRHWYCRSEYLPLTPLNPNHLRLINDRKLRREAHECHPLPPNWRPR